MPSVGNGCISEKLLCAAFDPCPVVYFFSQYFLITNGVFLLRECNKLF